ncbi:MAG: hemolysin family protein, partial [Methanoregula sp.]
MNLFAECFAILLLILMNGLFAFAEFSIISAKKTRLRQMADRHDPGAAAALAIGQDPTRFLSAIQIGVTLVGILVGAIGVVTLSEPIAGYLRSIALFAPYSTTISLVLIVLVTTYLTLVFGELVPKRVAMSHAEEFASIVARPMHYFAILTAPIVIVLSYSTELVLRALGIKKYSESPVTEEEIKVLIEQGTETGEIEESEADMVAGVFDLNDLRTEDLMTRRIDVIWLDINDPPQKNWKKIEESGRSYFPVYRDTIDNLAGIVSIKDLWNQVINGKPADLAAVLKKPFFVPGSISMLKLLESFRQSKKHIAIVLDEYGGVQGIITVSDILKVIVG